MKVSTSDGKTFTLERETDVDHQLLDALDMVRHVQIVGMHRQHPPGAPHLENYGVEVLIDAQAPEKLIADTGRQAIRSLGDLLRIGLREAALNGHVRANAADPQAQDPLPAVLIQLQDVLQVLSGVVAQRELVRQEVVGTHVGSSRADEASTVAKGGAQ